jgi:hypothetical protein
LGWRWRAVCALFKLVAFLPAKKAFEVPEGLVSLFDLRW